MGGKPEGTTDTKETTGVKETEKTTTAKAPQGVKAEALAKFPGDIIAQTKYILEHGPKVDFILPLADGEAQGAYETVQINGYKLTIKKGEMVNIPKAFAMLLAEKYRINMTAGKEMRIDGNIEKEKALS